MSVARSSSGMFMIGGIAYRLEWVSFAIENALSAGKGRMGVHSVGEGGEVCYLQLPCLHLNLDVQKFSRCVLSVPNIVSKRCIRKGDRRQEKR